LNCKTDLFITDVSLKSEVFLNEVLQLSLEDRMKDLNNHIFSKVYRIILQDDEQAMKRLLECPDEKEEEAFKIFSSLQDQLQSSLDTENKLMEERIE